MNRIDYKYGNIEDSSVQKYDIRIDIGTENWKPLCVKRRRIVIST